MLFLFQRQYYTEFHPDAWITQPWNAWSSVALLLPAFFWAWALRGQYLRYIGLLPILPLALVNGVGSFMWHATSEPGIYLDLDTKPPLLLLGWLGIYFCRLLTGRWWAGILVFVAFAYGVMELKELARPLLDVGSITFNYIFNATVVILPGLIVMIKYRGAGWGWVIFTLALLLIAIQFRIYDGHRPMFSWMPQGTHFLWHIACALAYLPLGKYIVVLEDRYRERKADRAMLRAQA